MQGLAIFDIDGTLTDTMAVDSECFCRAVADVLRLDPAALDWSDAPHVTDAALLTWLCERYCHRPLQQTEAEATRSRFLDLLRAELDWRPERFRPIPGATDMFSRLKSKRWEIAVATGGWRASAELKLMAIGLDPHDFVLASASDAPTRTGILATAIARVHHPFDRVVSVGDAVWDVHAAASAALPFVGLASGTRAERLRSAGASIVLADLTDTAALSTALAEAEVPARTNAST